MGLDITAVRGASLLAPHPQDEKDWDEKCCYGTGEWKRNRYHLSHDNGEFPEQGEGILRGCYSVREHFHFRAGSYSGYSAYRRHLAAAVGVMDLGRWWQKPTVVPFAEQLNFSDCEGVIGPQTATKLLKDYKEWVQPFRRQIQRAAPMELEWYEQCYQNWIRAFQMAADGGFVVFH